MSRSRRLRDLRKGKRVKGMTWTEQHMATYGNKRLKMVKAITEQLRKKGTR